MYVYIDNNNAFVIVKVIGGTLAADEEARHVSVATDNTCASVNELDLFLRNSIYEIERYIQQTISELNILSSINLEPNNLPSSQRKLEIFNKLSDYKEIIKIIQENISPGEILSPSSSSVTIQKLIEDIPAGHYDSQTNRDRYLKSSNPVFSVPHEIFSIDGPDILKESKLGTTLRECIKKIKLEHKSRRNKFNDNLENYDDIPFDLSDEDILGIIYGCWEMSCPESTWQFVEDTFKERISNIRKYTNDEYVQKNHILNAVDDEIWELYIENKEQHIYKEIYANFHENIEKYSDKISVYIQFLLGKITLYISDKYKKKINLGMIFENNRNLRLVLTDVLQKTMSIEGDIEEAVLKLVRDKIEIVGTEINEEDKEIIITKAKLEYNTIKNSAHFDEFYFCTTDKTSNWFSYGSAISIELGQFIEKISSVAPRIIEQIKEKNLYTYLKQQSLEFKDKVLRQDGNYIRYYDEYKTYKVENLTENINQYTYDIEILRHALNYLQHDVEGILRLIEKTDINKIRSDEKLLTFAGNNEKVYRRILKSGASVNIKLEDDLTYLVQAILNKDFTLIKVLIENGIDVNFESRVYGRAIQYITRLEKKSRLKLLEYLVRGNVDLNLDFGDKTVVTTDGDITWNLRSYLIHEIIWGREYELIEYAIDNGLDVNKICAAGTALQLLCESRENYNGVISLLLKKGANPNIISLNKNYPIYSLIINNNIIMTKKLVYFGAKLYVKNKVNFLSRLEGGKDNPEYNNILGLYVDKNSNAEELLAAAQYQQYEIIAELLKRDIPTRVYDKDNLSILQILINHHIEESNTKDNPNQIEESRKIITALMESESNLNEVMFDDLSLLQYLIIKQQHDLIDMLLLNDININFVDNKGETALFKAVIAEDITAVKILLHYKAQTEVDNAKSPLEYLSSKLRDNNNPNKEDLSYIKTILLENIRVMNYKKWQTIKIDKSTLKLLVVAILEIAICSLYHTKIVYISSMFIFSMFSIALSNDIKPLAKITHKKENIESSELATNEVNNRNGDDTHNLIIEKTPTKAQIKC